MNRKKTKIKFIILLILVGGLLFIAAFASHLVPYDHMSRIWRMRWQNQMHLICLEQTDMEETCFPE